MKANTLTQVNIGKVAIESLQTQGRLDMDAGTKLRELLNLTTKVVDVIHSEDGAKFMFGLGGFNRLVFLQLSLTYLAIWLNCLDEQNRTNTPSKEIRATQERILKLVSKVLEKVSRLPQNMREYLSQTITSN